MTGARFLAVKNFETYQHYHDRTPPWIKLYNSLLDDYAFLSLPESAQINLVKLWLLASRHDNRIPNDLAYISGKLLPKSAIDIDELILSGFLIKTDYAPTKRNKKKARKPRSDRGLRRKQNASTLLTKSSKNAMLEGEGEGEVEKEREKIKSIPPSVAPNWVDRGVQLWRAKVGDTTHPRLGKALSGCVATHGADVVLEALAEYADAPANGRPKKLEWFAQDIVRWIAEAKEPLEQDGVLTAKGRRFMEVAS